jgi:hypothetical protein
LKIIIIIIIIEFQRKTRLKGKKKKLTVVTCVVSTGMRTNEKSVAIQPHTSPTVAGFGFGGGGGTWGDETPPGGLAGTWTHRREDWREEDED